MRCGEPLSPQTLVDEPGQEVFLERLMGLRSATSQHGVSLLRDVFDLDARHGAIRRAFVMLRLSISGVSPWASSVIPSRRRWTSSLLPVNHAKLSRDCCSSWVSAVAASTRS